MREIKNLLSIGIDHEVERIFFEYNWPGNIRELENTLEHAIVMCSNKIIGIEDLPDSFKKNINKNFQIRNISLESNLYKTLAYVEKNMILQALEKSNHIQTKAAEILGIGKSGLNQKIKKYKIRSKKH